MKVNLNLQMEHQFDQVSCYGFQTFKPQLELKLQFLQQLDPHPTDLGIRNGPLDFWLGRFGRIGQVIQSVGQPWALLLIGLIIMFLGFKILGDGPSDWIVCLGGVAWLRKNWLAFQVKWLLNEIYTIESLLH